MIGVDPMRLIMPIILPFPLGKISFAKLASMAVLMMISTAYNNRDDIIVGQTIQSIPMSSRVLLDRVRLP